VTDAERLRTALVNILSNARHAVAARLASVAQDVRPALGPDIDIETHAAPHSFRITVRDRGVGVKHQDLARVFDPYFTTKRTGSGLGLAIAKNIVEGMGGSVALESQPGVGTEIRLDIPIHQVGLSAPPAKESALAHHSARRVGGA
jgi:signal transduction histidine kinase